MPAKKIKKSSVKKTRSKTVKSKKKLSAKQSVKKKSVKKKDSNKIKKSASLKKAGSKKIKKKASSASIKKKLKSKNTKQKKVKKTAKTFSSVQKTKKLKKTVKKKEKTVSSQKSAFSNIDKRRILEFKKELDEIQKRQEEEVVIKDAEGRRYCKDEHCDQPAVTDVYCRYHYLSLWKFLQDRKKLFKNQHIDKTIKTLVASFGDMALLFLIRDFKSEKNFETAIKEMGLFLDKEEDNFNASEAESPF